MIKYLLAPVLLLVLGLSGAVPIITAAPAHADHRRVLRPGDRGVDVVWLQKRLRRLGFTPGEPTGSYGPETQVALWAFQKSQGLRVRNDVRPVVWEALDGAWRLLPLVAGGAATRVEIDLDKQLMAVYKGGRDPALVSHISTGAGVQYCNQGVCRMAITPVGDFRVTTRAPGWTTGPLGSMYNSLYFYGGVAIHGSTRVPNQPASHGCVRLPMHVADKVFRMVAVGTPVHVRRGGMIRDFPTAKDLRGFHQTRKTEVRRPQQRRPQQEARPQEEARPQQVARPQQEARPQQVARPQQEVSRPREEALRPQGQVRRPRGDAGRGNRW